MDRQRRRTRADHTEKRQAPSHADTLTAARQSKLSRAAQQHDATRSEPLRRGAGELPPDAETIARAGTRGPSGPVPHREAMERSFATGLGDVPSHSGPEARAACQALGADAYAFEGRVAFRDASPPASTVAHELTHVLRHGADELPSLGVPAAEREAGQVEQAVSRGQPATTAMSVGAGSSGRVLRSEVREDTTEIATVSAAGTTPLNASAEDGAASLGDLAQNDRVRILERHPPNARVVVISGALVGQIGFVPIASLTVAGAATSLVTGAGGVQDAMARLRAELTGGSPQRRRVLNIIGFELTNDQRATLIQDGNADWAQLVAANVLQPADYLHVLSLCGAPLVRKVTEYLDRRGRDVPEFRLIFATANDDERLAVARDDALIGRLERILGTTHPEIIFGTALQQLYPDFDLEALTATRPNLAGWLRSRTGRRETLQETSEARAQGLRNALEAMRTQRPGDARPVVQDAMNAAPRGMALPAAERAALDEIMGLAYEQAEYNARDMTIMLLTRWGRLLQNGARKPKSFLHELHRSLLQLPMDQVLLNNVFTRIEEDTSAGASGSYTDFLTSADFGEITYDRPQASRPVHATTAQNSRTIEVQEPHIDLWQAGNAVEVDATGGTVPSSVRSVDSGRRRVRLRNTVDVAAGAEIRNTTTGLDRRLPAVRPSREADLVANNAGAPNPGTVLGRAGVNTRMVRGTREQEVAGTRYVIVMPLVGQFQNQLAWIDATALENVAGDLTTSEDIFSWTVRHEVGHSIDTQIGGFSAFSSVCPARWVKYSGRDLWLTNVISAGGVANAGTEVERDGVTLSFEAAAATYAQAVQSRSAGSAPAQRALRWLRHWRDNGGTAAVFDTVTHFEAEGAYYMHGGTGVPALGSRVYAYHYGEWFSFVASARSDSLAAGVRAYAYTCTYEFFADHYAAYTQPGRGDERYSRAVPNWAQNFFDRVAGREGAGPRLGLR